MARDHDQLARAELPPTVGLSVRILVAHQELVAETDGVPAVRNEVVVEHVIGRTIGNASDAVALKCHDLGVDSVEGISEYGVQTFRHLHHLRKSAEDRAASRLPHDVFGKELLPLPEVATILCNGVPVREILDFAFVAVTVVDGLHHLPISNRPDAARSFIHRYR
jgi:hypothetical protein